MGNAANNGHFFKSSFDLDDVTVSEIVGKYLKTVIFTSVIWMILMGGLIGYCICLSSGGLLSTLGGIIGGVAEIIMTLRIITALLSAGKAYKRNFTWIRGMVTGYRFGLNGKIPFLGVHIDSSYLCNKWANPFCRPGSVVYFLVVGNSEHSAQNILVKM